MSEITKRPDSNLDSPKEDQNNPIDDLTTSLNASVNKLFLEKGEDLPIAKKGLILMRQSINTYARDLINESSKIAARDDMENIDAPHVREAKENLYRRKKLDRNKIPGIGGGLLLGAVFSNVLGIVINGLEVSGVHIVVMVGVSVVGAGLVVWGVVGR